MALIKLEIRTRQAFAGGESFGDVGRYERIDGVAHFAVDSGNTDNAVIADIGLAPRNGDGLVEFSADFRIVKPETTTMGTDGCCWTW